MTYLEKLKEKRKALFARYDEIQNIVSDDFDNFTDEMRAERVEIQNDIRDINTKIKDEESAQEFSRNIELPVSDPVATPGEHPAIGMEEDDVREYSLLRAIRASADKDWTGAELEREASVAVAKKLGRSPQGFFVPYDVLVARDMTVGTATAGGNLVATDLKPESFIELLRNKVVVSELGATILSGLVGDVAIPKRTGANTSYWLNESGEPTEGQASIGQVVLTPKTVGAYTELTRKLLQQSSIDVENFVKGDLARVLALAIDLAALHGTGASNQPTGIAATTGIGSVAIGANGGAIDWAKVVELETAVAIDNADAGNLAYLTNTKVRGALKTTEKAAGTAQFIWGEDVNGYKAAVTNQVASDLDKGTSIDVCSAMFFGNWADLLIGTWGSLDILVDPYSLSKSGGMRITAFQDVDIAVRHPESFAACLDITT